MSGRGGNNHRVYRDRDNDSWQKNTKRGQRSPDNSRYNKSRGTVSERLQWIPPVISTEPLPAPDCPYCGKPIKDIASAIGDKNSNLPVHFDCMVAKITENERLEKGDVIAYIGGGRFGIIHFNGPQHTSVFKIKKIWELEDKENQAVWRKTISDRYSVT